MPLGGSRNRGRRVSNPNRNPNSRTPGGADTLQLGRAAPNVFARVRIVLTLVRRRLRRGVYDPKKGLLVRPKRHTSPRVLETVLAAEGFAPESKPRKTRQKRPRSKLCDQAFRAPPRRPLIRSDNRASQKTVRRNGARAPATQQVWLVSQGASQTDTEQLAPATQTDTDKS